MSFLRSIRVRKPSSSKRPTSPVRMKRLPSASNHSASAVLRRLVVVAGHHRRPSGRRLRRPRPARHFAAVLVDQPDVVAPAGLADGVQLVGMLVGGEDAGAAALGHAVVLDQPARPALRARRPSARRRTARWCRTSCGTTTGRSGRTRARHHAAGTAPAPAWCGWRGGARPARGSGAASNFGISTTRAAEGQRREEARPAWCWSRAASRAASPSSAP